MTLGVAVAALLGVLALWFIVYGFLLTSLQEHGTQARLYERFRLELSAATAPLGGAIKAGSPVALISALPGGQHDLVVVEGTTAGVLTAGPGHESDTPLPGQAGTSIILGRSFTFGGPFAGITDLKVGQKFTVTTGQGVFSFKVSDRRSPGDLVPRLSPNQAALTLVTSQSSGWRSGWAPSRAVYVDAVMVGGSAQPTPAGLPARVGKASLPMQGDPHALVPFIFWVQGLLVAVAAVIWSWLRWGRKQAWLVGVPIVLAVLWGTSGALMRFLPNLI